MSRIYQFAHPTHVEEVRHDHVRASIARHPGVGAATPLHLRMVLHMDAVGTYWPVGRTKPIIVNTQTNRQRRRNASMRCGDVALESDEEEADAVEQVFIATAVIRAGRRR